MTEPKVFSAGGPMPEKMTETVKVETYLKRIKCPNGKCPGFVEADGKERTEGGAHGGTREYRHKCTKCDLGLWIKDKYPKVEYKAVGQANQVAYPILDDPLKGIS